MKAAVYTRYGAPDVIEIKELDKPAPKENEALIRVRAASVNPYDWHFMRGEPYGVRLMAGGLRKPKDPRLGADVAGIVEAVGASVKQFQQSDEVFGMCKGAFAEYACASEGSLARKPSNIRFEEAASVPIAGLTALQALRDKGQLKAGEKVLVNGAAGGVGTFGVQISKAFGAEVTGVCSTRNLEIVRAIGADHVIDYTKEDFTKGAQRYNLILDAVGNHSFGECRRVLHPGGILVGAGGGSDNWMIRPISQAVSSMVLSWFVSQKPRMILAKPNKEDLMALGELMATGKTNEAEPLSVMTEAGRIAARWLRNSPAVT